MYNTCGECGQADCQCGSYSSRSRCKWIVLAVCCCLLLATILGVVLGLIPVYLKGKLLKSIQNFFLFLFK